MMPGCGCVSGRVMIDGRVGAEDVPGSACMESFHRSLELLRISHHTLAWWLMWRWTLTLLSSQIGYRICGGEPTCARAMQHSTALNPDRSGMTDTRYSRMGLALLSSPPMDPVQGELDQLMEERRRVTGKDRRTSGTERIYRR